MAAARQDRELAVMASLRELTAAFDRLAGAMTMDTGLNRTDLRALEVIARRDRLTAGELAASLRLTTGAVTGVIDRLERSGHARRQADTEDRRRVVVLPTRQARGTLRPMLDGLGQRLAAELKAYSDVELELIGDFLARSGRAVGTHADGLARP